MPCSVDIQKAKEQHGAMVGSRQFRIDRREIYPGTTSGNDSDRCICHLNSCLQIADQIRNCFGN